jgi:hypothetical protein
MEKIENKDYEEYEAKIDRKLFERMTSGEIESIVTSFSKGEVDVVPNEWVENWEYISMTEELSEDFIRKFANHVDWKLISKYQKLSESFIREFSDRVCWNKIIVFQKISDDLLKEFIGKIDFEEFFKGTTIMGAKILKFIADNNHANDEIKTRVYNFNLPDDLREYLKDKSNKNKSTISQEIINLILRDREEDSVYSEPKFIFYKINENIKMGGDSYFSVDEYIDEGSGKKHLSRKDIFHAETIKEIDEYIEHQYNNKVVEKKVIRTVIKVPYQIGEVKKIDLENGMVNLDFDVSEIMNNNNYKSAEEVLLKYEINFRLLSDVFYDGNISLKKNKFIPYFNNAGIKKDYKLSFVLDFRDKLKDFDKSLISPNSVEVVMIYKLKI